MPEQPRTDLALMLIGLPGSGKSSFARQLVEQSPRWQLLSTDALREQLFGQASIQGPWSAIEQALDQQLRAARLAQRPVILDSTQARRRHRRLALAQLAQAGYGAVGGLWLREPLGRCCQRNRDRDRQVPRAVIQAMHRSLTAAPPRLDEGFSQLWISQGGMSNGEPSNRDRRFTSNAPPGIPNALGHTQRYWLRSRPSPRQEAPTAASLLSDSLLMAQLDQAAWT